LPELLIRKDRNINKCKSQVVKGEVLTRNFTPKETKSSKRQDLINKNDCLNNQNPNFYDSSKNFTANSHYL